MAEPLDVDAIRAAHKAVTKGPWRWSGNTDNGDVRLVGRRGDVFALISRDRTPDDPGAHAYAEHLQDVHRWDQSANKGKGGWRELTADERAEALRDDWLTEDGEIPRTDNRLAFYVPGFAYEFARDLSVYEVARNQGLPDDTPDTDERIYRRDVVDVRNPNAAFLRDSWQYVDSLLGEVDRLRAALAKARELNDEMANALDHDELSDLGRSLDDVIEAAIGKREATS